MLSINIKEWISLNMFIYFIAIYKAMWWDSIPKVFISVFCLAVTGKCRWLTGTCPLPPRRKALTFVDYFGTGAVISNIVVRESWRQEWHVYRWSNTYQISLRVFVYLKVLMEGYLHFVFWVYLRVLYFFLNKLTKISLNSITRFILSLEMHWVSFEVGIKSLKIIWKHFKLLSVNK